MKARNVRKLFKLPASLRWRGIKAWILDFPWAVSIWLSCLLLLHSVSATYIGWLNPWAGVERETNIGLALYGLLASASALLAGFAGVVTMFGLQTGSDRFQRFRRLGGDSLVDNWVSLTALPFLALAFSVLGFLFSANELKFGVIATANLAVWFLLHASVRTIFIFRRLIDGVTAEDNVADYSERTISSSQLSQLRRRS